MVSGSAGDGLAEGGSRVMEDVQLHNPMVFPERDSDDSAGEGGRKMQVVLDAPDRGTAAPCQSFQQGRRGCRGGMDAACGRTLAARCSDVVR